MLRAGRKDDISTPAVGFPERDSNHLLLGSDDGPLYEAKIYECVDVRTLYGSLAVLLLLHRRVFFCSDTICKVRFKNVLYLCARSTVILFAA